MIWGLIIGFVAGAGTMYGAMKFFELIAALGSH